MPSPSPTEKPAQLPAKIHRLALFGQVSCGLGALSFVIAAVYFWLIIGPSEAALLIGIDELSSATLTVDQGLPFWTALLVTTLATLFFAPWLVALWSIQRVFAAVRADRLLSTEAAFDLRKGGIACFVGAICGALSPTVYSVLLTLHNAPMTRQVTAAFGSDEIWPLCAGALLIILGAGIARAVDIERENKGFV